MADKKLNIKVRTQGAKRAKKELKGVEGGMKSLGKAAAKAGAAFFAARAIISGLQKVIELSTKLEGVERGFNNLTKAAGFSAETFTNLQKATDGTVDSVELMTQANNAMLLGIFESEEQMANMFDTAQRLAKALGKDTRFGIESLVTGMGRQSKLMLDNLGIMVKTEDAYKQFAQSLGIATSELSDLQRKQAFVNATIKEANKLVSTLGAEQLTTGDSIAQMGSAVKDAAISLGTLLAPVIVHVSDNFRDAASFSKDFLDGLNNLMEFGDIGGLESLKKQSDGTLGGIANLGKAFNILRTEALALGIDLRAAEKSILLNDEGKFNDLRTRYKLLLALMEEEKNKRVEIEVAHQDKLKELQSNAMVQKSEEVEILGDIALTEEEILFLKQNRVELSHTEKQVSAAYLVVQEKLRDKALEEKEIREKMAQFASQTAISLGTSALMGDNVTESLKRAVIQLAIMVAQAKIYAAIMAAATPGGWIASIGSFLFGASPTQAAPSASVASSSKIVINNNISGFGTIDSNFASNSLIPAINKAISTGQARLG